MRDKKAFLWATIGGIVVALLMPFISAAVQTYVIPTGTTGQRTEMLTNAPNRDEALRSSFSGTSAPSSPTPVAGQLWMDTAGDILNFRNAAGSAWSPIARRNTKGDLPSAVAYEDEANTFTLNQTVSKSLPVLTLNETASSGALIAFQNGGVGKINLVYDVASDQLRLDDVGVANRVGWERTTGKQVFGIVPSSRLYNNAGTTALFNSSTVMTAGTIPLARIQGDIQTEVWDPPSIAAGTTAQSSTFSWSTNCQEDDFVIVTTSNTTDLSTLIVQARMVLGGDLGRIYLANVSAGAIDPPSMSFYVKCIKRN